MIWGVVVSQNWHVTGHIFTDPWIHTIQRHPVLSDTPRIIHDDARFPYHHTLYDGAKRYSCFPRRRSVATWHALSLHLHQNGAPGDCLIYGVSKTLIASFSYDARRLWYHVFHTMLYRTIEFLYRRPGDFRIIHACHTIKGTL